MTTLPILLSAGGVVEFEDVPTGNRLALRLLRVDADNATIEIGGDLGLFSIVRLGPPPTDPAATVADENGQP